MSSSGEFDHDHLLEKYVVPPSDWPKTLDFGAPSHDEAIIILDDVRTAESRLSPLGAEIERAVDVINKLKCRRDEFRYYIAEHQAFLAPIRRLPAEILSLIFCRFCDPKENLSSRFPKHQFTLATVCRRWRAIVLSTPEIWSKLRVEFYNHNIKRCTAMTRAWLSNSGTCRLSLELKERYHHSSPPRWKHPMLKVIKPYCDRIESLDLDVHAETLFAFTSNEGTFPALQSIKIYISGSYGPDPPNAWRALETAPALRRVYFHNIFRPRTVKLPWIQLTVLFFGDKVPIKLRKSLDILRRCPNLESCAFLSINATSSLNPSIGNEEILHSNLRLLQVRTRQSLSNFFDRLTLPALRDIHVAYDSGQAQFVSLLARSPCRIERFVIDTQLTPHHFIQCFKSMPHLAELDIRQYTSSTSFRKLLQQLTLVGKSSHDLCPALRVLHLSNDPPLGSRDLVNMVNSRNRGMHSPNAVSIQSIHISLEQMTLNVLADLKDIRKQGVKLFITDPTGTNYDSLLTMSFDVELPSRKKWSLFEIQDTS